MKIEAINMILAFLGLIIVIWGNYIDNLHIKGVGVGISISTIIYSIIGLIQLKNNNYDKR